MRNSARLVVAVLLGLTAIPLALADSGHSENCRTHEGQYRPEHCRKAPHRRAYQRRTYSHSVVQAGHRHENEHLRQRQGGATGGGEVARPHTMVQQGERGTSPSNPRNPGTD